MKKFSKIALAVLILIALGISAYFYASGAPANVHPFDAANAAPEVRYCQYTIRSKKGDGAHDVGDTICVAKGYEDCEDRIIIPHKGIEYFGEAQNSAFGVSCEGVDLDNFYENI